MAMKDIPVESLYIAGGVCGGIILILLAILLFFCCAPYRKKRKRPPDFEAVPPNRRPQPIAVNDPEPTEASPSKPFAWVAPTPVGTMARSEGVENPAADLSDSLSDRQQLYPIDPLGATCLMPTAPPPQYVEVTADYLKVNDPPPAYSSPMGRRWLSTGHLQDQLAQLSVTDLQEQQARSARVNRSLHNLHNDEVSGDTDQTRRPKRVVYEVVV